LASGTRDKGCAWRSVEREPTSYIKFTFRPRGQDDSNRTGEPRVTFVKLSIHSLRAAPLI